MGFAKGGTTVVVGGATIAGFFAAACSLPFDYVKTQMQKMKPDPVTGEVPFKVRWQRGGRERGGAEGALARCARCECRHCLPARQALPLHARLFACLSMRGAGCVGRVQGSQSSCERPPPPTPMPRPLMRAQSSMDCALKTLRTKGPFEFYTGFPTYCVRIAPHAALTLVFVAWLPRLQAQVGM